MAFGDDIDGLLDGGELGGGSLGAGVPVATFPSSTGTGDALDGLSDAGDLAVGSLYAGVLVDGLLVNGLPRLSFCALVKRWTYRMLGAWWMAYCVMGSWCMTRWVPEFGLTAR